MNNSGPWRRAREGRWVGGVCAGLARKTGWPLPVVRLVFAVVAAIPILPGLPAYLLLWFFLPEED